MVEAHTNIDGAMNKYWSKQNLCAASGAAAPSGQHSFDAASSCQVCRKWRRCEGGDADDVVLRPAGVYKGGNTCAVVRAATNASSGGSEGGNYD